MKKPLEDLKSLIRKISEGDEKAFRTVYSMHYDQIYSVAFSFIKSPQFAEDIVQEVFLKIWQKRAKLPTIEKFDSYLFIMARNQILLELKNRLRTTEYVDSLRIYFPENGDTPLQNLINKDSEDLIKRSIEKLPLQQKRVYLLCREDNLSYEEIAKIMKISKNTVRNHMSCALRFIRHYLLLHN